MNITSDEQVKDLVCGMVKSKSQMKATSVYNAKTYYFCSEQDKEMFDAYPDKWIPKGGERSK